MPTNTKVRSVVGLVILVAVSAAGGFFAARFPAVMDPQVRAAAQDRTHEYVNTWAGVRILQFPNDLVTYQEVITEQEPDWIVETGTNAGGLTLYLSTVLQAVKPEGRILTVDIDRTGWDHTVATLKNPNARKLLDRVEFIEGGSTAPEVTNRVRQRVGTGSKVLVILDSLHERDHVMAEMTAYGELVHPGGYMVVTDTHLDAVWGQVGPRAALDAFLPGHPEFVPDRSRDRFMVSANLGGWLRKAGPR